MEEEALLDAWNLSLAEGFKGSKEDFTKLLQSNSDFFNLSFETFKGKDFDGDEEAYSNLLGIQRPQPSEESVAKPSVEQELPVGVAAPKPQPTKGSKILPVGVASQEQLDTQPKVASLDNKPVQDFELYQKLDATDNPYTKEVTRAIINTQNQARQAYSEQIVPLRKEKYDELSKELIPFVSDKKQKIQSNLDAGEITAEEANTQFQEYVKGVDENVMKQVNNSFDLREKEQKILNPIYAKLEKDAAALNKMEKVSVDMEMDKVLKEKRDQIGFWENIGSAFQNEWIKTKMLPTQITQVASQLTEDFETDEPQPMITWGEDGFGIEYKTKQEQQIDNYKALEGMRGELNDTKQIIDSWENGDYSGVASASVGSAINFAGSMARAMLTKGISMTGEMTEPVWTEAVKAKAEKTGKTEEEIIAEDSEDELTALSIGAFMTLAERTGMKGFQQFAKGKLFKDQIRKEVKRQAPSLAKTVRKEVATELTQGGLEKANTEILKGEEGLYSVEGGKVLWEEMKDFVLSKEGAETAISTTIGTILLGKTVRGVGALTKLARGKKYVPEFTEGEISEMIDKQKTLLSDLNKLYVTGAIGEDQYNDSKQLLEELNSVNETLEPNNPQRAKSIKLIAERETEKNRMVSLDETQQGKSKARIEEINNELKEIAEEAAPVEEAVPVDERQKELDDAIAEADAEVAALRESDGSVSKENEAAFKKAVKKRSGLFSFGEENKGRISLKEKAEVGKDRTEYLSEKQAALADKVIQAIIDSGIKDGLSAQEISDQIINRHAFILTEVQAIQRYVAGLVNNTTEQGNSKQSFSAWRQGKMDSDLTTKTEPAPKASTQVAPTQVAPTTTEETTTEDITEAEKTKIAEEIGKARKVKPKNIKGLLDVMGGIFGLNKKQAESASVVGDVIIGNMAKRAGISKDEMYQKIAYQKANLEDIEKLSEKGKVLYQIVGENANLTQVIKDNLATARQMEATEDPKTIKIATGWERGADGKWRYETVDNIPFLKDTVRSINKFILEEGLDNGNGILGGEGKLILPPELLELYPQLKDVEIFFDREMSEYEGSYYPNKNKIVVGLGVRPENTVRLLLHEIQHAIQEIEGFAKGGNAASSFSIKNDIINEYEKELKERGADTDQNLLNSITRKYITGAKDVFLEDAGREENRPPFIINRYTFRKKVGTEKIFGREITKYEDLPKGLTFYKNVAGEVEARNVEKRMNMTSEQRRASILEETEDVARDEQVVLFAADGSLKQAALFQGARGAMTAADGNYVVYALTNPNVSTPLHELAHVYEHYLTDKERADIESWSGHNAGTVEFSEAFARGFEKFLAGGKVNNPRLQKIFENFKEWLTEIYNGITGSEIDIELNDKMKSIYNEMLGATEAKKIKDEINAKYDTELKTLNEQQNAEEIQSTKEQGGQETTQESAAAQAKEIADSKPIIKMTFPTNIEIRKAKDVGKAVAERDRIKEEYKELKSVLDCLWKTSL